MWLDARGKADLEKAVSQGNALDSNAIINRRTYLVSNKHWCERVVLLLEPEPDRTRKPRSKHRRCHAQQFVRGTLSQSRRRTVTYCRDWVTLGLHLRLPPRCISSTRRPLRKCQIKQDWLLRTSCVATRAPFMIIIVTMRTPISSPSHVRMV